MKKIEFKLASCLLNQLYSLENSTDHEVNEDFSIGLMEQAAAELQTLTAGDLRKLLELIETLTLEEKDEGRKAFFLDFGDNFGLADFEE